MLWPSGAKRMPLAKRGRPASRSPKSIATRSRADADDSHWSAGGARTAGAPRPLRARDAEGRRRSDEIGPSHRFESLRSLLVEIGSEVTLEEGHQDVPEKRAARHPLEVAPTAVVVRAVELPSGEGPLDPAKECLMVGMH